MEISLYCGFDIICLTPIPIKLLLKNCITKAVISRGDRQFLTPPETKKCSLRDVFTKTIISKMNT